MALVSCCDGEKAPFDVNHDDIQNIRNAFCHDGEVTRPYSYSIFTSVIQSPLSLLVCWPTETLLLENTPSGLARPVVPMDYDTN